MKPTVDNCSVVVFEFVEQKFELQIVIEVFFPIVDVQFAAFGAWPAAISKDESFAPHEKSKQASE